MKRLGFIVAASLFLSPLTSAFASQKAVVIVPVADLRSDQSLPEPGKSDNKQQTQLLFGETVEVVKTEGDWVYVNAIEQPEFTTHQKWEGYPGWVLRTALRPGVPTGQPTFSVQAPWTDLWDRARDPNGEGLSPSRLPMGSQLRAVKEERHVLGKPDNNWSEIRDVEPPLWAATVTLHNLKENKTTGRRFRILQIASALIGDSYAWGGLTPLDDTHKIRLTGVDCSGLTHLSYRINGITIPRDSMEQYMKSEKLKRKDLKPADLVFSAKKENPTKITHVALYAGDGQLIEAPQTGMVVRRISFNDKFGKDFATVESGDTVSDRVVYFGRLLKD